MTANVLGGYDKQFGKTEIVESVKMVIVRKHALFTPSSFQFTYFQNGGWTATVLNKNRKKRRT